MKEYLLKKEISEKDFWDVCKLHFEEFNVDKDLEQIQSESISWERLINCECEQECIIKESERVLGSSYIILTSNELADKFLSAEINENDLLLNSRKIKKFDCIYLCSAIILPEFRNKGFIFESSKRVIANSIEEFGMQFPKLFYWPFSNIGEKLSKKIANYFKFEILKKEGKFSLFR